MNKKNILKQTTDHHAYLINLLKDQTTAELYLKIALEEYKEGKDLAAFLLALRNLTEAQGGIATLSGKTKISRQHLYRALSTNGNPRLTTLGTILNGLGFQLSIVKHSEKMLPIPKKMEKIITELTQPNSF